MMYKQLLCSRIKKLRVERGLTQDKFGLHFCNVRIGGRGQTILRREDCKRGRPLW